MNEEHEDDIEQQRDKYVQTMFKLMNNMGLCIIMLIKSSKLFLISFIHFTIFIEFDALHQNEIPSSQLKLYKFLIHLISKLGKIESGCQTTGPLIEGQPWLFGGERDNGSKSCLPKLSDYLKKTL